MIADTPNVSSTIVARRLVRNCGATTDDVTEIYLSKKHGEIEGTEPVFRADKLSNLSLEWDDDATLILRYDRARIFHFRSFWYEADSDTTVQVRIQGGA